MTGIDVAGDDFQRSLLAAIIEASPDGILAVDGRGIIVAHNTRFMLLWRIPKQLAQGAGRGSAVGASDDPILAAVLDRVADRDGFLQRVQELYASQYREDHSEIDLNDGRTLERDSTVLRGPDDQYLGRVWFFREVTRQKRATASWQAQARLDPLTGIMNRGYFAERARQEFDRAERYQTPLSIAVVDIDHFKDINDQFGHAAGDDVLKAVSNAASVMIRKTNLFGRIGGEEFAVLLSADNLDGARRFGESLRAAIAAIRVPIDGREIACTASVGLAERRADDTAVEDCLKRADRAMYRAKANGRNRVEVDD